MAEFWTTNLSTVNASDVPESQRVTSITLQTYAGQSDLATVRLASTTGYSGLVYTSDPSITLSLNDSRGFAPAIEYQVDEGKVGSTIFVKLTADLDAEEGQRESALYAGANVLTLDYYLAGTHEGDIETKSAYDRYLGSDTLNILEQFDNEGEAVTLYRWEPIVKPTTVPTIMSNDRFHSVNDPAEWCNPHNALVGYKLHDTLSTKAFLGDQELSIDMLVNHQQDEVTYSDTSRILLPPDTFDPKPEGPPVLFSVYSDQTSLFQRTQWTIKRHDAEYALLNLRKQSYYRGQFIYWIADLARIQYPGADSNEGFLPWNQLYDNQGKLVQYVKSWSRETIESPYDSLDLGGTGT